jgi:hypothetical protein
VALTALVGRLLEDNEQRDHDERRDHQWMDRCRAIRPTNIARTDENAYRIAPAAWRRVRMGARREGCPVTYG